MSTELRSNRVIAFDGNPKDWEAWSEKFLARDKRKGCNELLTGRERIRTASEYEYLKMKEQMKKSEVAKYAIPGYNEELGF